MTIRVIITHDEPQAVKSLAVFVTDRPKLIPASVAEIEAAIANQDKSASVELIEGTLATLTPTVVLKPGKTATVHVHAGNTVIVEEFDGE